MRAYISMILAAIVLNANIINTIKKIKENHDTLANLLIGSICTIVIINGFLEICGK